MANIIKTSNSKDLTGYVTVTSATNSNIKIFAENKRMIGDIKTSISGKGKLKIVVTGKYLVITGEGNYVVKYHIISKCVQCKIVLAKVNLLDV